MRRSSTDRKQPPVKPVTKIELSEKHVQWRLIAVIALIAVGCVAFIMGIINYLNKDSGWTQIEATSSSEVNCSEDFVFQYNLGVSGISATAENKAVVTLYTDACVKAFEIFNSDMSFDGVTNIYEINQHPNEILTVDDVLYEAFEKIQESGRRELYLGPVYEMYDNLFYCNDDSETVSFDPYENEEAASAYSDMAAYASDASQIGLELLGNNQIRLNVSEDYLIYARENYIEKYIDFYWMKNAFIIDYIAQVMIDQGYTFGNISSFDGFVRNLDESGSVTYAFNLYNRDDETVSPEAVLNYSTPLSIVYLRNYRMSSLDDRFYYEYDNGDIRTSYLSVADGQCKSSVNNMVCYSLGDGCADLLLQVIPIYISDSFDSESVLSLAQQEIYTIYFDNGELICNDAKALITDYAQAEE